MAKIKFKRTLHSRSRTQRASKDDEASLLLREIWGLQNASSKDAQLYLQHFNNCTTPLSVKGDLLVPTPYQDFLEMVEFVKAGKDKSLSSLKTDILAKSPRWLATRTEEAAGKAIDFGVTTWLMIDPTGWENHVTLRDYVASRFPERALTASAMPLPHEELMFNARKLYRVAGLEIVWTSLINRHLQLDSRTSRVYVFRHASMLHSQGIANASDIYPKRLLIETAETMALLFSNVDSPRRRWDRQIRTAADVDVESGVARKVSQHPESYVYWRERLKLIQEFYDKSKPRKMRQFLYDNRDTNQQATFWFAAMAIILTLLFGLIQSITGILQVALNLNLD